MPQAKECGAAILVPPLKPIFGRQGGTGDRLHVHVHIYIYILGGGASFVAVERGLVGDGNVGRLWAFTY